MYKVNISIDDVTPHPHSSIKVLDRCFELIELFPDIKFTLFVPIAYYRTVPLPPESICKQPMYIDSFPDFCDALLKLPDENFELGYHGLYHGIPQKTNNNEFWHLSYSEAYEKIEQMFEICKSAGLFDKMMPVFRPPAWRVSPEAIRALRDCGISVLGLYPDQDYKDIYGGEQNKRDDVVYTTCCPPIKPLDWYEKTEIVYHACEWDKNYLNQDLCLSLIDFLKSSDDYQFCFIGDMV